MKKIDTIYIIDDDRIIIFGIQKMLKRTVTSDTISAFANGKLAFQKIKDLHGANAPLPDVIILDINMPLMDGWQFLDALIALPLTKKIHINIVTSSIDPLDLQNFELYKTRTVHPLHYYRKPLNTDKIKQMANAF